MAVCRGAEDEYYERASGHCFHLLDKVSPDNLGIGGTPELHEVNGIYSFSLILNTLYKIIDGNLCKYGKHDGNSYKSRNSNVHTLSLNF